MRNNFHPINKRFFLVGSSRSGTTILQTLLAGHSKIHSFPETFFFINAIGVRSRILAHFGLASGNARKSLLRVLKIIQLEEYNESVPKYSISLKKYISIYCQLLDCETKKAGKKYWLEKSPMHIRYIPFIYKYIPRVSFIHIIRNGSDVVASIYDRAQKYPDRFKKQKNIKFAVKLWNKSLSISAKYFGKNNHFFVLYDELVKNPELVLKKICCDMGLDFERNMLDVSQSAKKVILPNRPWLFNAKKNPQLREKKFPRLFDEETQKQILESLSLKKYEILKDAILKQIDD